MTASQQQLFKFSDIAMTMQPSAIRKLLKVTETPDIISFGGGLPNPESFPISEIKEIFNELIETHGKKMLQYGSTEGLTSLNVAIAKMLKEREGINVTKEELIQTTGSQEALYMIGKIFANPGDIVFSEAPTYTGTISAFKASFIKMIGIRMDNDGIDTDLLEEKIKSNRNAKLIYVIPNFQNPSGLTMSLDRRKHLLEIASKYSIPIVEDDPYGALRYSGKKVPSIKSMDKEGLVIYLGTFSKILAPGFRLGYVAAPHEVIEKLNLSKQAVDLASSTLSQYIAESYLTKGYLDKQLPKIIELYKKKRDLMLESMEKYFPKGVDWTRPEGGMFLWVTKKGANTDALFQKAMEKKVAYVVGSAFYPDGDNHESMRLNFTYSSDQEIVEGIKRLADVLS